MVRLAHFEKQTLCFSVHLLQSVGQVVANYVLSVHHLPDGLHVLGVRVDGHPDVETRVVVQVGHVLREVGLGGEEGVVQDLVRLGHHLVQVGVEPFALLGELAELVHVLPDHLVAHSLLRRARVQRAA